MSEIIIEFCTETKDIIFKNLPNGYKVSDDLELMKLVSEGAKKMRGIW